MMRFHNDFQKMERMRNMEFNLLFLLTVEMIITIVGYYTKDTFGILNKNITDTIYLFWIFNLLLASFFAGILSPINFAIYRIAFRLAHSSATAYIFYTTGFMMIPFYLVGYFLLESLYITNGISNQQMNYPSKWILNLADEYQKRTMVENIEGPRIHPFTSVACESIRKGAFEKNETFDDLFEYETAYEDVLFPIIQSSKSKRCGTFIV
ncbi:uncharacterized protein CELE_C49F5.3 [Caenorhabditis elegans]|uniref:Uncharacterized protein n=1 Tax=Caenorhabditis elegans TaxID=6239 RepID=O17682_CAEEL|nr:Uncharacterized protein CELE_C49F5.3 [Caenorhabditis elegans]CAB03977.2 Uncharacterized protein CELE_C49F5.3 [Caenorhabditis elegans]